ncbi:MULTISPECIES: FxSxx-COOH cyclophane-containing RiPP peptide [Streptomyces]|uniref:FxSxx-COOH protein n=1 Tax=Streptomyces olivaceiscleroticus TaxID=68245 RepID=A0ABN0ZUD2_9ACTN|nr:FxSxx-COOH cyclophane-containing RiPP peptide [Streptomyces niger]
MSASGKDTEARPADGAEAAGTAVPRAGELPELPDLLALDLAELRTVEHPVLAEVLERIRTRVDEPTEMLWGFNSAF